jgi:hypothetical protein
LEAFEIEIIELWKRERDRLGHDQYDMVDALSDYLELNPKIDPEDIVFSEAFKARLSIDAVERNLLKGSAEIKAARNEINELEI